MRSAGIHVENSFAKGLITEETGLNFPENACTDTWNCIFDRSGEVKRRRGIDYELNYTLLTPTGSRGDQAVVEYLWEAAGGDGNSNFHVQQIGQYLYFFSVGTPLSGNKHSTEIDLSNFAVAGATNVYQYPCSFATGDGKLFVVSQHLEPFYVTYTPSSDTLSTGTQITIEVRDTDGDTADPYDDNERPDSVTTTSVDVHHLYNLLNQGWNEDVEVDSGGTANPISDWDTGRADLPSNADQWWIFRDTNNDFSLSTIAQYTFSSTRVPRGHFIYNAFDIDRETTSDIDAKFSRSDANTLTNTTSGVYRPNSVAFFANRVWYAGVNSAGYNSRIYFSQVFTDISKVGKCYQQQDPTDEDLADILTNDGGVLVIPEIANVIYMYEFDKSLFIFASNGIWSITGSEGIGFTATDFSIRKVSSMQNSAQQAFIDVNGTPIWINSLGVWVLSNQNTTDAEPQNLTNTTIQTFFETIPLTSIPFVKGIYNHSERRVYWLFRSTESTSINLNYNYDKCLVLDIETGAFYPWDLSISNTRKIIGILLTSGFGVETTEVPVFDSNDDNVVDSVAVNVTVDQTSVISIAPGASFVTEDGDNKICFAAEYKTTYLDWETPLGIGLDYSSYFDTGYKLRGEAIRSQQSSYVSIYSRTDEDSSFFIRGKWGFRNAASTTRWSSPQQGYKHKANTDYSARKLKLRGNGVALQLRVESDRGKPFSIIGWSAYDLVNNVP